MKNEWVTIAKCTLQDVYTYACVEKQMTLTAAYSLTPASGRYTPSNWMS